MFRNEKIRISLTPTIPSIVDNRYVPYKICSHKKRNIVGKPKRYHRANKTFVLFLMST